MEKQPTTSEKGKTDAAKNEKDTDKSRIWWLMLLLAAAGLIFLALVSIQRLEVGDEPNRFKYLITLGTALVMSGACYGIGAMTGFIFGIPRIINITPMHKPVKSTRGTLLHNDNLVEISDCLPRSL